MQSKSTQQKTSETVKSAFFINILFISASLFLAFILRLSLIGSRYGDSMIFAKWYHFVQSHGGFYAMKYNFTDYGPPYFYLAAALTYIHLPKPFSIINIKWIAIFWDFMLAGATYFVVNIRYNKYVSFLSSSLILLLPTIFINSSFAGNNDSIYATLIIGCLYFFLKERPIMGMLLFAIAFSFKLQAIFLCPFLFILFTKKSIRLIYFAIVPVVYFFTILPAHLVGRPLLDLFTIYFHQANEYHTLSINAPTLYTWIPSTKQSFYSWLIPGIILAAACALLFSFVVYRSGRATTKEFMIKVSFLSVTMLPFFLPSIHERYFYLSDVISIIYAFYFPKYFYIPIMMQIASLFSYFHWLFKSAIIQESYLAFIVLGVLIISLADLVHDLYFKERNLSSKAKHNFSDKFQYDHINHENSNLAVFESRISEPIKDDRNPPDISYSLSVILPAYNEEQVIACTISNILEVLPKWLTDFEVIVINDGSTDGTASILAAMSESNPHIRLITHTSNQGYGASLSSGFAAATKELTFFMDSDGQFDIQDLSSFFSFIEGYDAVIGYRIDRQDPWIRKLNAWGWKCLIGLLLGVHVRDIDCAFKLLRTEFLHSHPLRTRGSMISAELLYRLKQAKCTFKEVGVRHLPRLTGQATGANLKVVFCALKDLFFFRIQSYIKQDNYPMRCWHWITLVLIVALSTFLNFFQLQFQHQAETSSLYYAYYATAVHSMLLNWKNFFFLAYDLNGFMSIDKPPLDFWLQAASAKLFGFSIWSLTFPQALAGVLTVIVLFLLVRRLCGPEAGLLAALVMATMPVNVYISRTNEVDMMMVLIVLLAAWALHYAIETGKRSWLLVAAALVGLGFNTKMAEAYLVVPAFGLFYLLSSPRHWRVRRIDLALALGILLAVSLAWIVAVDLTPANLRPYVSQTAANSEMQLALDHNGFATLVGSNQTQTSNLINQPRRQSPVLTAEPTNGGKRGPFRLFNVALGGYIAWLLPLAIMGLLALCWKSRIRLPLDPWQQAAVFWGMWLVAIYVVFSVTSDVEPYYTAILAPAIAALTGCGLISMWHEYCERPLSDWRGWALPVALGLTAIVQVHLLSLFTGWQSWQAWLSPLILSLSLVAALLLVSIRLLQQWPQQAQIQQQYPLNFINDCLIRLQEGGRQVRTSQRIVLTTIILVLLLIPLIWSNVVTLTLSKTDSLVSGPSTPYIPLNFLSVKRHNTTLILSPKQQKLVHYLQAYQGQTHFLVATISVKTEYIWARVMLATGKPVMTLGGFAGKDPILTVQNLKHLIAHRSIRFFWLPAIYKFHIDRSGAFAHSPKLVSNGRNKLRRFGQNEALIMWVNNHCSPIQATKEDTTPLTNYNSNEGLSDLLFDCSHANLGPAPK